MIVRIFLWAAIVFAPIASAMAFLIVYGEYRKHFTERSIPLKIAFRTTLWTFIVFVTLLFLAAFLFQNLD
ncbi:MAG TPA: hypothetical protein PKJ72_12870 [Deltaproteobacteria bacterium]|jgi:hypothetical protein|nr:hypothetical protein [Deltaproteobacteria bacterium]HNS90932.1 hypothetical protein [Deltaproteobacteria bacterium]